MRTLRTAHNFSCAGPIWFDVETYLLWTSYFVCPCQMISWVIKVFHIRKQKIQPNCVFLKWRCYFLSVWEELARPKGLKKWGLYYSSQYQYHIHSQSWHSDGFKYISYYSDSWFVCCFMSHAVHNWGSCVHKIYCRSGCDVAVLSIMSENWKVSGQGFDGGGQAVPCLLHPLLLGDDLLVVNLGLELIKKKVIKDKLCQTIFLLLLSSPPLTPLEVELDLQKLWDSCQSSQSGHPVDIKNDECKQKTFSKGTPDQEANKKNK